MPTAHLTIDDSDCCQILDRDLRERSEGSPSFQSEIQVILKPRDDPPGAMNISELTGASVSSRYAYVWLEDLARYERVILNPMRTPVGVALARSELKAVLSSERRELEIITTLVEERRVLGDMMLQRMTRTLEKAQEEEEK